MTLPRPYYQDAHVTLYHGDCRELREHLPSYDILCTDPPYGMNFQSNYRKVKHAAIRGDQSYYPWSLVLSFALMARSASYAFCRWESLMAYDGEKQPASVLTWIKNNWSMGDLKHEHGRQWEAIAFWPGWKHRFIKRIPDVLVADRTGNELHPTQKPEHLMKQLIAANEGEMVLDPFAGSGTTLVSAKNLGRRAIGIELEEKYCETAAKRLTQSILNFELDTNQGAGL